MFVFIWAENSQSRHCKNVNYRVHLFLNNLNVDHLFDINNPIPRSVITNVLDRYDTQLNVAWSNSIVNNVGKLRTYRLFKKVYGTEHYVKINMPHNYRSAYAKFRCGVAPIRIETGRYEHLPVEQRICPMCNNNFVEDEIHVLTECAMYSDLRYDLTGLARFFNREYELLNNVDKFCFLMSFDKLVFNTAKTLFLILTRRRALLYL